MLDKPAGIAVHGGSGVSFGVIEALRALRPEEPLELVHRLDRDTSGCLLVARHARRAARPARAAARRRFREALPGAVEGQWDWAASASMCRCAPTRAWAASAPCGWTPPARPRRAAFGPVQFFGKRATLVEVTLITGRTHQIRVHAAACRPPGRGRREVRRRGVQREHARARPRAHVPARSSVSFKWPQGGEFSVNTPLPPELAAVLERARRRGPAGRASQRGCTQGRR